MKAPTFIIINPHCHQGTGWKRWKQIRGEALDRLPLAKVIVTESLNELNLQLGSIFTENEQSCIISAGGDGSIHQIANAVLKLEQPSKHTLGAIGLGSSNDFLKPFQTFIQKIPARINTNSRLLHDVGEVRYTDIHDTLQKKYFIINASTGVTAEGNWNFNNPGKILKWLKKVNTNTAINYAALTTIFSYQNKTAIVCIDGQDTEMNISNMNILKIPFVSGSFHYQQNILPDDGLLGLNICMDMKRMELIHTLMQLENGKFDTGIKSLSAFVKKIRILSPAPIVFECDGETEESTNIEITVRPQAVNVLNA